MTSAADLALVNGRVRTLDPGREFATAIAVHGGRITAVGGDAEIRALCDGETELIDLAGACATPGLIDSHMHTFSGALRSRGANLRAVENLEQLRQALHAEAAKCGPGEWVLGWGLGYGAFADAAISSAAIDDAVGGRPAALTFSDLHTILASQQALKAAEIDGPREFVEHAEVVCADGRPTGELREHAAMDLVRNAIPELPFEQRYRLCAEHLRRLTAVGLTGTHMMDGTLAWLEMLAALESRGDLITRVLAPFTIYPDTTEEMWAVYAACGRSAGRRWRGGVAKFFIDGVIDSGTGWLLEPDSEGQGLESFWPDLDRYQRAVRFFAERGYQCVTHAIGDMGVRFALDTYEQVGSAPGVRHRVEHIETIQLSDLPRFASLGVVASMQPQHMLGLAPDRSDNWSTRLGRDRSGRAYMTRTLLESGALMAFGSDWPVAHFDPREGMAAARLRRPGGATERLPYDDQTISAEAALHGYTRGAALTAGDEERLGYLRPGFCADITVFESDPVDCDADRLPSLPVLATIVDGELVHRAPGV
jgi:predicted amidohydrolase YtcJ